MSFFEYVDLVAHVLTFVPLRELESHAQVSRSLSLAVAKRLGQIRVWKLQARTFAQQGSMARASILELPLIELVPGAELTPSLRFTLRPLYNLTRLDLVACRVSVGDLAAGLHVVRGTLQELRVEMICVVQAAAEEDDNKAVVELSHLTRFELSPSNSKLLQLVSFGGGGGGGITRLTSHKKLLQDKCSCCGKSRPGSKCGQCRFYAFCERDCQVENWNSPTAGHKQVCCAQDVDSISQLLLLGCKQGKVQELDLAHYWQPNLLFPCPEEPGGYRGGPVFTRLSMSEMFASLVSLRLVRCGVRDEDVLLVCQSAPHVVRIDLSLNTKVSDLALQYMGRYWGKQMVDVRLRQAHRVTEAAICDLVLAMPNAVYLDLRYGLKRTRPNPGGGNSVHIKILAPTSPRVLHAIASACRHLQVCKLLVARHTAAPPGTESIFHLEHSVSATAACDFDEPWGDE